MILQVLPSLNPQWSLEALSVEGETLYINGRAHHLPSLTDECDPDWFCGQPELIDGVWLVRLICPYDGVPTKPIAPQAPLNVTNGDIKLPLFVV